MPSAYLSELEDLLGRVAHLRENALERALLAALATTAIGFAQSPAPAEVVKLSAFEVSGEAPNRYQASEVTSGGRLRTAIFDSPCGVDR